MRLLIVSNRLPINVVEESDGLRFQQSPGGLVSGISAYLDSLQGPPAEQMEYVWIGWPGVTVRDELKSEVTRKIQTEFHAHPVYLSEDAMEKFYHGFCNKIIWPLFHYFPSFAVYDESYWEQYQEVNEIFCQAVLEILKPGDIVWVHDYHLMLLPKLLKDKTTGIPIGFFLHIPFPSFEVFRLLPPQWGQTVLEGLLGADLVGFHTHDYAQYFVRSVARLLGHEHNLGKIMVGERLVAVDMFPMGIDYAKFSHGTSNLTVRELTSTFSSALQAWKVILSIDRLDYSKGIIHRLQGYRLFLERFPEWRGKVVLLLHVVPSRIGVEHYQVMHRQINELVGEINGTFGELTWTPIIYQHKFLPLTLLLATYSVSDIALITPLRDGMNLIAKEYLASRTNQTGVLILSEMAGAVHELGEAIVINPNDTHAIASALVQALEMPMEEQKRRNTFMQDRLQRYDVMRWSDDFLTRLLGLTSHQQRYDVKYLAPQNADALCANFSRARNRLLLLDYDGTLVPFADEPRNAVPSDQLLGIVRKLTAVPGVTTVIISGRDHTELDEWFGAFGIPLVAEHGAWTMEAGEWHLAHAVDSEWKSQIISRMHVYSERLPGSFVEEKQFGISWHYRKSDPELSSLRAAEVMEDLVTLTANMDVHVLAGHYVIEVKHRGINKGRAASQWIGNHEYDFILAIGDDRTDEDMFAILPLYADSIKVGHAPSRARYFLNDDCEVRQLLERLIDCE